MERLIAGLAAAATLGFGVHAQAPAPSPSVDPITLRGTEAPPDAVWLDSLDLTNWQQRRQRRSPPPSRAMER